MCLCVFVDFVMGGCVNVSIFNVWFCVCVDYVMLDVCICGFCNVLVCVCVDFVICGCVYVLDF